jgi:hypothetical protein
LIVAATSIHAGAAETKGMITACSGFGNGCYIAPVRQGNFGQQVQLKSGTWIDCRSDCKETLRQDVLDFWETQNKKAMSLR